MNLAQPFSSVSVAAGLETGLSQATKPAPAAGAVEFTSPKSAIQPLAEIQSTQTLVRIEDRRHGSHTLTG